jgi:hypothetical protein
MRADITATARPAAWPAQSNTPPWRQMTLEQRFDYLFQEHLALKARVAELEKKHDNEIHITYKA